jgi:5-methylcytosine-specific restriction protein B
MFANWQRPWSIYHTFIFNAKVRETTQMYLDQIGKQLISDLGIHDYQLHTVDYYGASNFGSDECWLALYPIQKESHRDAYQFFVRINNNPEAGRVAGHSLPNASPNLLKNISSYDECVSVLNEVKQGIIKLNKERRSFYKLSPGSQASEWQSFWKQKIAALNYYDLGVGDIRPIQSREQLNVKAGYSADNQTNKTWNLWLFKSANIGDIIFANKGTNTCLGIGIIKGEYYYEESADKYNHRREVEWITDKVYQYKADSFEDYKTLFRPDTFSPTKVSNFLFLEYIRLYPELEKVFKSHGIEITHDEGEKSFVAEEQEEYVTKNMNFWWLNANPSIWSISSVKEGDRQSYTARNEKGNKRRIYKHFETVKPGDLMIGYESSPVKQIKAIFEISQALHLTEKEGEVFEFEMVEKLEVPVHWSELQSDPGLRNCEVFINNQGSLFRLTEEEFDIIRSYIDTKNINQEREIQAADLKKYSYKTDPDKPFVPEQEFNRTIQLLKRKKNIILQGPPGVGKTFLARKMAYEILGSVNDAQIEMIQFHQSYSYEDFIQGLRPGRNGFELRNGIFYTFCKRALAHPDRPFFFVIDEINRGNLSKILGEMMMLIEADKRGPKYSVKLTYAEDESDTFYVPDNLYIIGTMNTADRSLAIVDYALRRRFAFIQIHPHFGSEFRSLLKRRGISEGLIDHLCSTTAKVNGKIKSDIDLGDGFQIGHSYFCQFQNEQHENDWWNDILQFEIRPLLEEIWFDDTKKAEEMLSLLNR